MALFRRTKKDTEEKSAAVSTSVHPDDLSHVLRQPRITEKATVASGLGVYVFDVAPNATKPQIKAAVARYYKVTPRMVRIVSIPEKSVRNMRTGQRGVTRGGKKAYVYLKKGETITIT
jgi:large subunit ribosomal protein L23